MAARLLTFLAGMLTCLLLLATVAFLSVRAMGSGLTFGHLKTGMASFCEDAIPSRHQSPVKPLCCISPAGMVIFP